MTFEQWLSTTAGQLAASYTLPDSRELRETSLRLAFAAGELAGMRQSRERDQRSLAEHADNTCGEVVP